MREATEGNVLHRWLPGAKIKFLAPFFMFIMGIEPIINMREAPSGSILPDSLKMKSPICNRKRLKPYIRITNKIKGYKRVVVFLSGRW